jgi:hypothetical protein
MLDGVWCIVLTRWMWPEMSGEEEDMRVGMVLGMEENLIIAPL